MKTQKLVAQLWEFEKHTVTYNYKTEIWWVNNASLEGLSFGKAGLKAAKQALRYAVGNDLVGSDLR